MEEFEEQQNEIVEVETDYPWFKEGDELGAAMSDYLRDYTRYLQSRGLYHKWIKHANYYYSQFNGSHAWEDTGLEKIGERGEYTFYGANHLRSLMKNIISIATVNPPVFDVKSVNSDARSIKLSKQGSVILDYYIHHKKLRNYINRAVEHSAVFDAGFLLLEWDPLEGKEFEENSNWEGDVTCYNPVAFDIAFPPLKDSWSDVDFVVIRQFVSKQKLITRYPHLAHEINSSTKSTFEGDDYRIGLYRELGLDTIMDEVEVFKLYHRKTEFMPNGRHAIALSSGKLLYDNPAGMPYSKIPVMRMAMDEEMSHLHGFSPINTLVASQEALNILNSTIITNQSNFGLQFVSIEQGSQVNPSQLDKGMALLEYPQGGKPPQGLNLTSTPAEVFRFRDNVMSDMDRIVGVSNVSRGETNSLQSGSALAFAASQTAQNQGSFAQNFADFASDMATTLLRMLRQFVNDKRKVAIFGKHSSGAIEFSAEDLIDFDRVICEMGNLITHTMAGRIQVANELLKMGQVDAAGYLEVLQSGTLEPILEGPQEEKNYVRQENEWLMDGKQPMVVELDNHQLHIAEHRKILMNADFRIPNNDPQALQVMQLTMQHIQEHQAMLAQQQGMGAVVPQEPQPGQPNPEKVAGSPQPLPAPAEQRIQQQGSDMPQMPQMPALPNAGG